MLPATQLKYGYLLCALFGVLTALALLLIAPPEISRYVAFDANTGAFASFARNVARYPLSLTLGMNTHFVGVDALKITAESTVIIHPDHPPLLTWLAAVMMTLFGQTILSGRLVEIFASGGVAAMAARIALDRFGALPAFVTAVVVVAAPLFSRHALQMSFEPLVAFLCLISLHYFARYLDKGAGRDFAIAMVVWVLGMLADWPAFFLGLTYFLFPFFRRDWKACIVVCILPPLMYVGIMGSFGMVNGRGVMYAYDFFMSNMAPHYDIGRYTFDTRWSTILAYVWQQAVLNFTLLMIIAGGIGCVAILAWRGVNASTRFIIISLLIVAVLNVVVFKFWALIHPYWSYYFLPPIALGTGALFSVVKPRLLRAAAAAAVAIAAIAWGATGAVEARRNGNLEFYIPSLKPQLDSQLVDLLSAAAKARTIYSDIDATMFGHGYIMRWYLDRQLTRPRVADIAAACRVEDDLILVNDTMHQAAPPAFAKTWHRSDLGASWWVRLGELSRAQPEGCETMLRALLPRQ